MINTLRFMNLPTALLTFFLSGVLSIPCNGQLSEAARMSSPFDAMMDSLMVRVEDSDGKAIEIMKYEVTNALWAEVMGEEIASNCPRCPKTQVNLDDVTAFIARMNQGLSRPVRLMSPIDFMNTVNYSNQVTRYSRRKRSALKKAAWIMSNSKGKVHPVGLKLPNDLGIYDLIGNAAEWTDEFYDCLKRNRDGEVSTIELHTPLYRIAGGSAISYWWDCRPGRFQSLTAEDRDPFVGFRLVRDAR